MTVILCNTRDCMFFKNNECKYGGWVTIRDGKCNKYFKSKNTCDDCSEKYFDDELINEFPEYCPKYDKTLYKFNDILKEE